MFSNLQKAKTFYYYREDPRKEGVPSIEISHLNTQIHQLNDVNDIRPKLPHAKTAITLGHKDNVNNYNGVKLNSKPLLTKTRSNLESRTPIRKGPVQFISLVSKSELFPKEPRTLSLISYKSRTFSDLQKNNNQNVNDRDRMNSSDSNGFNNWEGKFDENDLLKQNHGNEHNLMQDNELNDKVEEKLDIIQNVLNEEEEDEESAARRRRNKNFRENLENLKSNKSLINKNSKRIFQEDKNKHHGNVTDSDSENEKNHKESKTGEDWLLKWSIINNVRLKKHDDVFKRYDFLNVGHISGEPLVQAILSLYNLSNTKIDYLFNVLNLCEVDPFERGADLKLFKIITTLAEKINSLDEEWFFNLLPQLDISSVENKAFKIRRLWSYLVNSKSKMLSNRDLMIEFEAGGVTQEHIEFARRKFSDRLYFEITDYITYIPLFLLIHDRIINDPLGKYQDI